MTDQFGEYQPLVLYAEDIEEAMSVRRYTPEKLHPCGCVTKFDTLDWRSTAVTRCGEHFGRNEQS